MVIFPFLATLVPDNLIKANDEQSIIELIEHANLPVDGNLKMIAREETKRQSRTNKKHSKVIQAF